MELAERWAEAAGADAGGVFIAGFPAPVSLLQIAHDIARKPPSGTLGPRPFLLGRAIGALGMAIDALDDASRSRGSPQPQQRERLLRARDILSRDFWNNWTIEPLAQEVGVNEKQLRYGFRDLVGQPVYANLTGLCLDAARLLQEGASVAEAALAVGFGNLSHFSKVFREARGISPSLYVRRR